MKKLIIGIIVLALVGAGIYFFISSSAASTTASKTAQPTPPIPPVKAANKIVAEGKVVPVKSVALGVTSSGTVNKVAVAVGDRVQQGQVLASLETTQLNLQLAQSDANVAAAQAKLNQLKRSPTAEDLAAAQQNLVSAQAAYDSLLHPSANDLIALKADVDKTKALLDQANAAYDRVGGDTNPYAGMLPQRAQVQSAWIDYQKALALYNAKLTPSDAQVQQALAAVQTAKTQLAKLKPTDDDIAASQASLNALQAARDLIADQIKRAQIVAPFAGTVVSLDIKAGEYAAPGTALLRLADLSAWEIETTDLTELNIATVREGSPVNLTFDAISNLELPGKVSRIKLYGENRQGDIVYTLVVTPAQHDERLRWNMTSKVTITSE